MSAKLNNNHTNAAHSRENRAQTRRDEALARDLSRLGRSNEDQMDLISERRGNSRKEMSRLVGSGRQVKIHVPQEETYNVGS